jgi:hypothetical protein
MHLEQVAPSARSAEGGMTAEIFVLSPALEELRDHFVGWQCRVRQISVRKNGGRPLDGMRPRVTTLDGEELSPGIVTILNQADPTASIAMFKQAYKRTLDPRERYTRALEMLASAYYQRPKEFLDELTALFAADSRLAERLARDGECILEFGQFNQGYNIPCAVQELGERDLAYQATYWHNGLFNPALPPSPRILAFNPRWSAASATHAEGDG